MILHTILHTMLALDTFLGPTRRTAVRPGSIVERRANQCRRVRCEGRRRVVEPPRLTTLDDVSRGSFHSRSTRRSDEPEPPGQSVLAASFATRRPRVQIPPAPLNALVRAISSSPKRSRAVPFCHPVLHRRATGLRLEHLAADDVFKLVHHPIRARGVGFRLLGPISWGLYRRHRPTHRMVGRCCGTW